MRNTTGHRPPRPATGRHLVAVALAAAATLAAFPAHAQLEPWTGVAFSRDEPDPRRDLDGTPGELDRAGHAMARGDFDGDGFVDLAIGVPNASAGGVGWAGGVIVVYGSRSGLDARRQDFWSQDGPILGGPEAGDSCGVSVAAGDFDGDGNDDLAFGCYGEAIGSISAVGAVNVIYGTPNGLHPDGNQMWHQDVSGVGGGAEANDRFGVSVAAGDFDGDGRDDLAIGVMWEALGTTAGAGAVQVLWGSPGAGLTASGDQWIDRDSLGMGGAAENESFGRVLAVGNFDGDPYDDLAIGVPTDSRDVTRGGSLQIVPGTGSGLNTAGNTTWRLTSPGGYDSFATSLAVGDFDGDQLDDLAAGAPGRAVGSSSGAGAVLVLYGTGSGLSWTRSRMLEQGIDGIAGPTGADAGFGKGLGAGDLDGDTADDLVIGARYADADGLETSGSIHVVHGSTTFGLTGARDAIWTRSQLGNAGPPREGDLFGFEVALGDFNDGGTADIAVSARERSVSGVDQAGDVVVVYSDATLFRGTFETGSLTGWSSHVP